MKIEIQEISYQIYVCPRCKTFLSKNINKIPDLCPRCKTRLSIFDTPNPVLTRGQWKL